MTMHPFPTDPHSELSPISVHLLFRPLALTREAVERGNGKMSRFKGTGMQTPVHILHVCILIV